MLLGGCVESSGYVYSERFRGDVLEGPVDEGPAVVIEDERVYRPYWNHPRRPYRNWRYQDRYDPCLGLPGYDPRWDRCAY